MCVRKILGFKGGSTRLISDISIPSYISLFFNSDDRYNSISFRAKMIDGLNWDRT